MPERVILNLLKVEKSSGYSALRKKLRSMKTDRLDALFHAFHDEVFSHIDCLSCAACCINISPAIRDVDIRRLSRTLQMKPSEIVEKYMYLDDDLDYVFHKAPCPFLGPDNLCTVYEDRPGACREYPHTNRAHMHQILELTFKNASVCPAVKEILAKFESLQL